MAGVVKANGASPEGTTYSSLDMRERKRYKEWFVAEYKVLIDKKVPQHYMLKTAKEADEEVIVDVRKKEDTLSLIEDFFLSIRNAFKRTGKVHGTGKTRKTSSVFKFSERSPLIEYDIECLMRVIDNFDLSTEPGLFRKSASIIELNELVNKMASMREKLNLIDNGSPGGVEDRRNPGMIIDTIVSGLGDFGKHSIAGILKQILREVGPLFPIDYLEFYMGLGREQDPETILVLAKFILVFILNNEQRDRLEGICCFFNTVVNREKSALTYKSISVVLVPAFFVDDKHKMRVVDQQGSFKQNISLLENLLGFFLINCRRIFLIDSTEKLVSYDPGTV
jgi:RhoGAP domain